MRRTWNWSLICSSKSQDPDIRRIAEEAEARLIDDPQSGYSQWPSPPPPGPPPVVSNGQPLPQAAQDHEPPAHLADPASFSPSSPSAQNGQASATVSPQDNDPSGSAASDELYASPYDTQSPSAHRQTQAPLDAIAPLQSAPPIDPIFSNDTVHPYPQQAQGPPLQPAAPARVVLSRNRETKILLSIDGDGIRGLSALLLIESLVNAICVKLGQRLDPHQIFDLTGGSSLGGVIAILLCRLQMQAHRAREAYKQIARQVFLNKRDFFISLDPQASIPNGNGQELENEIRTVIQQELGTQDERLFDSREDSGDV